MKDSFKGDSVWADVSTRDWRMWKTKRTGGKSFAEDKNGFAWYDGVNCDFCATTVRSTSLEHHAREVAARATWIYVEIVLGATQTEFEHSRIRIFSIPGYLSVSENLQFNFFVITHVIKSRVDETKWRVPSVVFITYVVSFPCAYSCVHILKAKRLS